MDIYHACDFLWSPYSGILVGSSGSVFKTKLKLKKQKLLILYFPAKNSIMVKSCFGVVETSSGQEKLRKGWK